MIGHTSNFLNVHLPLDKKQLRKQVDVEIFELKNDMLFGKIIGE